MHTHEGAPVAFPGHASRVHVPLYAPEENVSTPEYPDLHEQAGAPAAPVGQATIEHVPVYCAVVRLNGTSAGAKPLIHPHGVPVALAGHATAVHPLVYAPLTNGNGPPGE